MVILTCRHKVEKILESNDPVNVPSNAFQPCSRLLSLSLALNPLAASNDDGKDIYHQAIDLCGQHLQNGCLHCST